jgi:cell fate (sporulation/competence/biofilm development) regulator YmcA (YheA/YmcA/DUF963 family)
MELAIHQKVATSLKETKTIQKAAQFHQAYNSRSAAKHS